MGKGEVVTISCRRDFLRLLTSAAALAFTPRYARAQAYPSRPVRLIVGFPPGGASDITARLMGQWLSDHFGQQFIVENRPGAGTNIGTEAVVRAAPDGYTLLLVSVANTVNATLYDKLSFNFLRDIVPVAGLIRGPLVMEVHPSVPATTAAEFIAYAKLNPGKINAASAGNGTPGYKDGDDKAAAQFYGLEGLTVKPDGSAIYVADGTRGEDVPYNRIRVIKN